MLIQPYSERSLRRVLTLRTPLRVQCYRVTAGGGMQTSTLVQREE